VNSKKCIVDLIGRNICWRRNGQRRGQSYRTEI